MSLPPPLPCCTAGSDAAWTGPAIPAGTGTAGSQSFAGARLSVTKASGLTAPHSLKEGNGEDRNLASRALAGTHRPPAQGLPINWVSHQECPVGHLVSCLSSLLRQMGMTEGQLPPRAMSRSRRWVGRVRRAQRACGQWGGAGRLPRHPWSTICQAESLPVPHPNPDMAPHPSPPGFGLGCLLCPEAPAHLPVLRLLGQCPRKPFLSLAQPSPHRFLCPRRVPTLGGGLIHLSFPRSI